MDVHRQGNGVEAGTTVTEGTTGGFIKRKQRDGKLALTSLLQSQQAVSVAAGVTFLPFTRLIYSSDQRAVQTRRGQLATEG